MVNELTQESFQTGKAIVTISVDLITAIADVCKRSEEQNPGMSAEQKETLLGKVVDKVVSNYKETHGSLKDFNKEGTGLYKLYKETRKAQEALVPCKTRSIGIWRDKSMANSYQIIDEKTWERAMHCMVFRNSVEPAFCVTFEAGITNFKCMVKEQGLSFTLAMVYAVCKCANKIEAFRYRFVDGQVVLYDKIDTAFTYLNKETDLFKVVNVPMIDDLKEYCELASKTANEQKEYFTGPLGNDVFQCSPMPWVTYTHISHTNSGKKDNATPLFDWGKYYEKDGKVMIPISVQTHHSFVDGLHIGLFVEQLQKFLNEC